MSIYNSWLCHHGVKGMKWGHRKDKGYSYTTNERGDFVLKKGSNIKRITTDKNEKHEGYEYASFTKRDNEKYKVDFISYLTNTSTLKSADVVTFQMTQKLTKDLVAPSDKQKVNTMLKMLRADKKLVSDLNHTYEIDMTGDDNAADRLYDLRSKMIRKGMSHDMANVYSIFSMSLYYSPEIRAKFFEELSDQGYNMIIDTEDAGKFTQAPIIVFNREDSVKLVKINKLPKQDSDEHNQMDYKSINRDKKLDKTLDGFN